MRRSFVIVSALAICATASAGVRVACVGDSITYGLGLADREREAYPAQLQKLFDESSPGKYEVRNFGNSGRGIYLDSMRGNEKRGFRYMAEHKAALDWKPDIVICNLGINDNGEYIKEYAGGRRRGQFAGFVPCGGRALAAPCTLYSDWGGCQQILTTLPQIRGIIGNS